MSAQVVDLSTGSRRDDVIASVGELRASKSGRFVVVVDYQRQHAVAVHCLDGLLRQIELEDIASGAKQRCTNYVEPAKQTALTTPPQSNVLHHCTGDSSNSLQPETEITIEEFDQGCKRPPPPPVRYFTYLLRRLKR